MSHTDFGVSVALSGDTLVVGAPWDDATGAAYVFNWNGEAWGSPTRLVADDGESVDAFGRCVDVDGNTAVASAMVDDTSGSGAGAAYVFVRGDDGWRQQAKVVPQASEQSINFCAGPLRGDMLMGSDHRNSAYLFVRSGDTWIEQARLGKGDDPIFEALSWRAVGISSDTALIRGYTLTSGGADANDIVAAINVYTRAGEAWTESEALVPQDRVMLGGAFAYDDDMAVINASPPSSQGFASDRVLVFTRNGATWSERAALRSPASAPFEFGLPLALGGGRLVAGEMSTGARRDLFRVYDRSGASLRAAHTIALPQSLPTGETLRANGALAVSASHIAISASAYSPDQTKRRDVVLVY